MNTSVGMCVLKKQKTKQKGFWLNALNMQSIFCELLYKYKYLLHIDIVT